MADNVVDLGQFGNPRPSPFAELPGVISDITHSNIDRERLSLDLIKSKQQSQLNKNRMTIALAKQQQEEDKTHHDNTVKALEQTSLYLADKDQTTQKLFQQSPHYKEIQKLAKKYAPEYVADDNSVILPEPKDVYKNALDKQKLNLQQKIQSGAQLSSGDQKLADFFKNTDNATIGNALHAATQDPSFKADPQGTMKTYIAAATQAKKSIQNQDTTTQSSPNPLSGAIAGDNQQQSNDPIGILKYLKPGSN